MKPFTKMFSYKALGCVSEFISPSQKNKKKQMQNENKQTKLITIYN